MTSFEINPRKQAAQTRSKETVRAILDATAHILEEEGLEELNTNIVALEAGVSIGSLYQYFPTKESIFASLVNRELKKQFKVFSSMVESYDECQGLETSIDELVEFLFLVFTKKRSIRINLLKNLPRGIMKEFKKIELDVHQLLLNKLKQFKLGYTDHELTVKTFVIIHGFVGIMMGTLSHSNILELDGLEQECKSFCRSILKRG
jgi:AcrR family transcriptional regulator